MAVKSCFRQILFKTFRKYETQLHELNYLFWECTIRCNLNCLHCGSDCSKNNNYPDMPLADFLQALETIPEKRNRITVVLTGGEPLLRKDLENCGREIRSRGFRWGMVSNGFLYTAEKHNSLLNAGMGALTFSVDGLQQTHNWLRNSSKSFQKVEKAIDLAVSSPRLNFDAVTCVNQRNISELDTMYRFLKDKNVKAWRLFTIAPIGRAVDHPELFLQPDQFRLLMDFVSEKRKRSEMDVKFSCEGFVGDFEEKVRDTRFFCRAGINIASVLIDGSISACPNIDRSFAQGNIYNDKLYEVWQNRFALFRDRKWMQTGMCSACKDFGICLGNGFHYRKKGKVNLLVCHQNLLQQTE